jgi:hypothetical protein
MENRDKTRIIFNFEFEIEGERRKSYEKLAQIICSSHWSSGFDILGILNESHRLLFDLIKNNVIVIDECEYLIHETDAESETTRNIKAILGKRSNHPVLSEMAALFTGEPFEASSKYRNTIYLPNEKAYAKADGMKPEDVTPMLASDECERIILFPYIQLNGKSAYYELTLSIEKSSFIDFMNRVEQERADKMYEAIMPVNERSKLDM